MRMILKLMLVIGSYAISVNAYANEDWYCMSDGGKRDGNTIQSCGVGEGLLEGVARHLALRSAFEEYEAICEVSADCHGKKVIAEPKRMTCKATENGRMYKCYRLVVFTLIN